METSWIDSLLGSVKMIPMSCVTFYFLYLYFSKPDGTSGKEPAAMQKLQEMQV